MVAQLQEEYGDNKHALRKPVNRPEGAAKDLPNTHVSGIPKSDTPQPRTRAAAAPKEEAKALHSNDGLVRGSVQRSYRSSPSYEALAREHKELLQERINGLKEDSFLEEDPLELGGLAAQFESGPEGVAAIGYDRVGGTSYGKYQISSRAGTMSRFIAYLREEEPDWANRLTASGKANTRGRRGAMPDTWKAIAKENPARFEALQDDFILRTNYHPAREAIMEATKVDVSSCSPVLQDVLHSTAVQHGPGGASRIFISALQRTGATPDKVAEEKLIEEIYRTRKRNFGSSSWRVRRAVAERLTTEKDMAIDLLKQGAMLADKDA
ncbi:hypothetical protein DGI_1128 [Megalodesulfovibrio gigas DSM 1382 = ATCC 19364]|uniref:Type VI secretion system spike protein VgrG3-like C-terminal domain-containing protein n=1 Tax=Megalodesulfovibrio gigas (strain ATCC 19364 / DSM 1382 / NCIMB 9332 / VKM B-1759) TaxID=1121448 RepID=T2G8S4_MEGG1|nr:hypothetical protein DGI_1128 [Megalodesulfovibrio gigas DSM 1382 = ATCC 19364]